MEDCGVWSISWRVLCAIEDHRQNRGEILAEECVEHLWSIVKHFVENCKEFCGAL